MSCPAGRPPPRSGSSRCLPGTSGTVRAGAGIATPVLEVAGVREPPPAAGTLALGFQQSSGSIESRLKLDPLKYFCSFANAAFIHLKSAFSIAPLMAYLVVHTSLWIKLIGLQRTEETFYASYK